MVSLCKYGVLTHILLQVSYAGEIPSCFLAVAYSGHQLTKPMCGIMGAARLFVPWCSLVHLRVHRNGDGEAIQRVTL